MFMPNFLLIGAARCGTTSLYHYLKQHPQTYMSPKKEPRFFAFEGEKLNFCGPGDDDMNNSITELSAYQEQFKEVSGERAVGEASAVYIYHTKCAERIHHYIPDVKLIAILRNPVERAYSYFLNLRKLGREPLTDFAQALREEETRIHNDWGPGWHYRQRGFYYRQLEKYFDIFCREQMQLYLFEDLVTDPVGLLQSIFSFINIDKEFVPNISFKYHVSGITNPRNVNLIKPPLTREVRKELLEGYREDILKLQGLIERDLSEWLE